MNEILIAIGGPENKLRKFLDDFRLNPLYQEFNTTLIKENYHIAYMHSNMMWDKAHSDTLDDIINCVMDINLSFKFIRIGEDFSDIEDLSYEAISETGEYDSTLNDLLYIHREIRTDNGIVL